MGGKGKDVREREDTIWNLTDLGVEVLWSRRFYRSNRPYGPGASQAYPSVKLLDERLFGAEPEAPQSPAGVEWPEVEGTPQSGQEGTVAEEEGQSPTGPTDRAIDELPMYVPGTAAEESVIFVVAEDEQDAFGAEHCEEIVPSPKATMDVAGDPELEDSFEIDVLVLPDIDSSSHELYRAAIEYRGTAGSFDLGLCMQEVRTCMRHLALPSVTLKALYGLTATQITAKTGAEGGSCLIPFFACPPARIIEEIDFVMPRPALRPFRRAQIAAMIGQSVATPVRFIACVPAPRMTYDPCQPASVPCLDGTTAADALDAPEALPEPEAGPSVGDHAGDVWDLVMPRPALRPFRRAQIAAMIGQSVATPVRFIACVPAPRMTYDPCQPASVPCLDGTTAADALDAPEALPDPEAGPSVGDHAGDVWDLVMPRPALRPFRRAQIAAMIGQSVATPVRFIACVPAPRMTYDPCQPASVPCLDGTTAADALDAPEALPDPEAGPSVGDHAGDVWDLVMPRPALRPFRRAQIAAMIGQSVATPVRFIACVPAPRMTYDPCQPASVPCLDGATAADALDAPEALPEPEAGPSVGDHAGDVWGLEADAGTAAEKPDLDPTCFPDNEQRLEEATEADEELVQIQAIVERISELESFDVTTIKKRFDPKVRQLFDRVNKTLAEIFGPDTPTYWHHRLPSLDTTSIARPSPGELTRWYEDGIFRAIMKLRRIIELLKHDRGQS